MLLVSALVVSRTTVSSIWVCIYMVYIWFGDKTRNKIYWLLYNLNRPITLHHLFRAILSLNQCHYHNSGILWYEEFFMITYERLPHTRSNTFEPFHDNLINTCHVDQSIENLPHRLTLVYLANPHRVAIRELRKR